MKILVTGGAGYIGSFMVNRLIDDGYWVWVLDSLERGHKEAVNPKANLLIGNLLDREFIKKIFSENKFDAVIHFAGLISMFESTQNPYFYFTNNFLGSLNLLQEMAEKNVDKIIFSSTAGVYGDPKEIPIIEDHPKNPTNPYGESKLMVERLLFWYKKVFGINFAALRYFNAAGASEDGKLGERHDPETHIIPIALKAALNNSEFILYGDDYRTKDGTCVRDYIHVLDLVEAHVLALKKLIKNGGAYYFNVGTGRGYSNKQVIGMVKEITGISFPVRTKDRRLGDADILIADSRKIKKELGFIPYHSDLDTIIRTAWKFYKNL